MEKFKTPKLLITDHYDEQIRHVDIYIEELLEKYKENDLLPKEEINKSSNTNDNDPYERDSDSSKSDSDDSDDSDDEYDYTKSDDETINKIEGFKDPYQSEYHYDQNKLLQLDVTPGKTRIRDYLELVRSKAIDELKKAEQYNLDNYELNKDLYKYDRNSLLDEKVEEMRQNLFKDKFAFVVKIEESNKSLLKLHTILTDFYLNEKDLKFLKRCLQPLKDLDEQKSRDILNEKCLFIHFVREYIIGLALKHRFGAEIISIEKSSLFEVNRAEIAYMLMGYVNLPSASSIDFSFIKSLKLRDASSIIGNDEGLFEIKDLSGLKQLEYLQLEDMNLNSNSFNGLDKLIKLELIECYTSKERLCFDSLINLQFLRIIELCFPIELKSLENLKVIMIDGIDKLKYILNVSESITYLQLNSFDIYMSKADDFFSRVFLPNLIYINMNYNKLSNIKKQWVTKILFLKELLLHENHLEKLNFCLFDCFLYLEKLDLSSNNIEKLDESGFSKLKRLKWLNLSKNPLLELGSNKFLGLKNLETLFLNDINEKKKLNKLEKDAFNGLTNLKNLTLEKNHLKYIDSEAFSHTPKLNELSLDFNNLESIDPKVFSYTPKLVELRICDNKMKLEENMFSNLKHVKKIVVKESDVEHINKDILEDLKKSNIEFIIK